MTKILSILFILLISSSAFAQDAKMFFQETDKFFAKHVVMGRVNYDGVKKSPMLDIFVNDITKVDLDAFDANTRKAYLINAYNLLVVSSIVKAYPISSVQETGQFFDKVTHTVSGKKMSLNQMEKTLLLGKTPDPRLHFVLVCGAIGCPPITNFAYTPDMLEEQMNAQTKSGLNDPAFLSVQDGELQISKIFEWYAQDFGANKQARIDFINQYRNSKVSDNAKFKFIDYDWSLNEVKSNGGQTSTNASANSARYVVSSTIPKGSAELKIFNNLYTQRSDTDIDTGSRSNFFTSTFSALYGVNKRFNAGLELKYRRVSNGNLPSSALTVFSDDESVTSKRNGVTGIGPKIRWAPTAALPNFSIQSTFQLPIGDELEGTRDQDDNVVRPFTDWQGAIWYTQLFNDFSIGNNFSLFTELDFWIEDIGDGDEGFSNIFSTPVSLIFSYFPNPKTTVYALGSYSPKWVEGFDYFYQFGLGTKYQFSPNFELELLISDFTSKFLVSDNGQAATFNLGIRYNL